MAPDPPDFTDGFPRPERAEWLAAVDRVLRGRAFDDVLVTTDHDGLEIQPLYTADVEPDAPPLLTAGPSLDPARVVGGWDVRQQHDADEGTNERVLLDLERGVTSVELSAPAAGWAVDSLETATEGVLLEIAPVVLAPHADLDAARALISIIASRDAATTACWLGLDPIGELARGGGSTTLDASAALAIEQATNLTRVRPITVDSTRYADAGCTPAQELGWAIATGVAYLRALEQAGLPIDRAAGMIGFRVSVAADQFGAIAALRAARTLWSRVLAVSGVAVPTHRHLIQAVTARSMFSRRDPWVNMLRSTSAVAGAAIGGADAITTLPFDTALGRSDTFSRRNARNTQLVLLEESHLARLVDPGRGSWFVESLTRRLAGAAWEYFRSVEASGGMEAALTSGEVATACDHAWQARLVGLATRTDPLTGVSEYPMFDESGPQSVGGPAAGDGDGDGRGLPLRRLAAPFEELRDAADRAAGNGTPPLVHLAALGDLASHAARTAWVTNLLAVGGIACAGGERDGALSPIEAGARFAAAGRSVAVICSSDRIYAERATATATALKEAGASLVVLAGDPGEARAELLAAGVDEFWHVGVDVLDVLRRLHRRLGIPTS